MASDENPELDDGRAGACAGRLNWVCVKALGHSQSFGGLRDAGIDDHLLRLGDLPWPSGAVLCAPKKRPAACVQAPQLAAPLAAPASTLTVKNTVFFDPYTSDHARNHGSQHGK